MNKLDIVFEVINEWSQLFGKWNWYSFTIIKLEFENDIMCPGYELYFVLLGLGFYFRVNRSWEGTEIEKRLEEVENGETISFEELKKDLMIDRIKENCLEYDGKWHMKDKDGNCKKFTMADLIKIIKND